CGVARKRLDELGAHASAAPGCGDVDVQVRRIGGQQRREGAEVCDVGKERIAQWILEATDEISDHVISIGDGDEHLVRMTRQIAAEPSLTEKPSRRVAFEMLNTA